MDKTIAEMHNVLFDEATCALYADILKQDIANIKVLFYIASCTQSNTPVTVKTITDNVKTTRKVGIRNEDNALSFIQKETYIDRKTAEKVVDRLAYASLIYMDVQRPFKYIKLTQRGIQVAIYIKQSEVK